ncbi:hypothetical protein FA13DRAFT_1788903 [Coprinellus micaceus]|uniref:Uncharacterized protein n=1 Tax=Coprinellus micaceus TaxID=71717 RepID=A0A4Y7TJW1_COPMI|nr:hypothetical protein FA13DRAFT_1788903 [Coprinellus micaceus]
MNSKGFEDPIAGLPNGRLVRAGRKKAAVWNLDRLPNHQSRRLKRRLSGALWSRSRSGDGDEDRDKERNSPGAKPHHVVKFAGDPDLEVGCWQSHPSALGTMLLAGDVYEGYARYDCRVMDLEQDGRTTMRFLGHGSEWFFDQQRRPKYLCYGGGRRASLRDNPWVSCTGAVVGHPDGIPYIFASDKSSECITPWDPRANKAVDDLATGNKEVVGMVWNDRRNDLWASTKCPYISPRGTHHGYDKSAFRRGWGWPHNAYHNDKYFGHVFDFGDHRIFRYSFKAEPNFEVVPEDGGVEPTDDRERPLFGGSGSFY